MSLPFRLKRFYIFPARLFFCICIFCFMHSLMWFSVKLDIAQILELNVLHFQVDMLALKLMNDNDLKEMGLPMVRISTLCTILFRIYNNLLRSPNENLETLYLLLTCHDTSFFLFLFFFESYGYGTVERLGPF